MPPVEYTPMQLHEFKVQLENYIKGVKGNELTVISVKAGDLRTLIALAEGALTQAAKDFPGGKVRVIPHGADLPEEPRVGNNSYVNHITE